ncbi:MAG: UTP--glucose-1-phosphate uridylyltransferase [Verrucomicrobiota bacterium]
MSSLLHIITSPDAATRNQSLDAFARAASLEQLLAACAELDTFRRLADNLYERVRALFFLYALHRFHIPNKLGAANTRTENSSAQIPFPGYEQLLNRRFEEAIDIFLKSQATDGPSDGISSALAAGYHRIAFQTLADQVRRSVRSVRGNQWMFRMGHPADQPLRLRPELLQRASDGTYPILREQTPVRMDLTHSAWSDIFFLGMDYPEGAKVLNISVDLGVHGRDTTTRPPVSAWLRVIDEPVLRLTSVDLGATADINSLSDIFDFAKDYLGLLKAAVIASGIVPPGIEGSGQSLGELLARIVGPGKGLEVVSCVNDIPKGSRLAVSTNLLGSLISVCMRATGQAASLTGPLEEPERRLVLARALLGEWLGGSGGGWQDSGGVWPGIKLITGVAAHEEDPEFSISRGRLMPTHHVFNRDEIPDSARQALQDSLVVVHGGMAQNVGPILEMVTEKYLLRSEAEWHGRQEALGVLDEVINALKRGDIKAVGAATTRNFRKPIQTIIPWASTYFTEQLIAKAETAFGQDFWGFWMLGGMSGGGMGFIFAPERKREAQQRMLQIMLETKRELQHTLPFAMDPVVFDYSINEHGTVADLLHGDHAIMPANYYALTVPGMLRQDLQSLPVARRAELDKFGAAARNKPELRGMVQNLFDVLLPKGKSEKTQGASLDELLEQNGFDRNQHEQIRTDLKEGRIGLAQNRLRADTQIEDVAEGDVTHHVVGQAPSPAISRAGALACSPVSLFNRFEKSQPATIKRRRLPHWTQDGATYFVTFRLKDSLPAEVREKWQQDRDAHLALLKNPDDKESFESAYALFQYKFEEQLDQGHGNCVLKDAAVADEMERCLRHFDGQRYTLGTYVIMPNHVHALVRPLADHTLSETLQGWKSVSAHNVKKLKGSAELGWLDEYFDHIIRDEHHLERFAAYISQNPTQAKLPKGTYRLGIGSGGTAEPESDEQAGAPARLEAGEGACPTTESELRSLGEAALRNGELAIISLAAGAGSRWTGGAGTCKALHPFAKLNGKHRTFIETHLAKSRKASQTYGNSIPHVFTTGYLTHQPTVDFLARVNNYNYQGPLHLSPGKSVGQRLIPTVRDLRFQWEEMPQQRLDEQQQKVRESLRHALMNWARSAGEASDYTDNLPLQCLHPVGHFYEVPNLLRNGVMAALLKERPQLKYLMLHNIDTLGANPDPALLGQHIQSGACLTFEVITRRLEDRGGGLAKVNGRVRFVEGLAMPREEAEFRLSYYNSNTAWIDIDKFLAVLSLTREDIISADDQKITAAIRTLAAKLPTYITLKDVKKRWGHGQEDVFPVAQFEKLWGDLTALPEIDSRFIVVPRSRGQQLKEPAQLDGWLRDGSAANVESLCAWE